MKVKNAKRIISIMLAFVLTLVFAVSVVHVFENEKKDNDPNVEVSALSGSGTKNDPYLIKTTDDMETFFGHDSTYVTGYVKLESDLDYLGKEFPMIASFAGEFDGQGHTISNINIEEENPYGSPVPIDYKSSLTLYLAGTIKNLKIKNFLLDCDKSGYSENSIFWANKNGAKIENCEISYILDSYYNKGGTANIELSSQYTGGAGSTSNHTSTFKNCYITGNVYNWNGKNINIYPFGNDSRIKVENCVIVNKNMSDRNHAGISLVNQGNTSFTNVQTNAGKPPFSYSSEGGDDVAKAWYYGGSQYNDGYPYLRQFIKNWNTINFNAGTGGSISKTYIKIPSDADQNIVTTGALIIKLEQSIQAIPNTELGYYWTSWTKNSSTSYTANFSKHSYLLTFANAKDIYNNLTDISPSETEYNIYHGEEVTASFDENSRELLYEFVDINNTPIDVIYTIPLKYDVKDYGIADKIVGETTITPKVELKKYDIIIKTSKNESVQTWEDVVYGTEITIKIENLRKETGAKVTTSYSSTSKEYLHNTIVGVNVNSESYEENTTITKTLTENLNIIIQVRDIISVTMNNAQTVGQVPTGYITPATKSGNNTLKVIEGENITCARNGQNLTYTSSTATRNYTTTYEAMDGYVVYTNATQVGSIKPISSTSITPKYYFYVCRVTINNTNTTAVTMKDGSNVTNSVAFNVDYGTEITFTVSQTNSIFTYTYTFTQPDRTTKIITYTTKETQYAMGTRGWEDEERIWATGIADIKFSGDDYEFKDPDVVPPASIDDVQLIISPTFGLKSYNVELG